ncbi:MAG: hypothetical protein HXS54_00985 [Theionarchaea archaeon]|nr:hypothetical protein [Theionarchaea archaeon]
MAKLKVKSAEEVERRWQEAMSKVPFLPCPACGRKTRAKNKCPWCGTEFKRFK